MGTPGYIRIRLMSGEEADNGILIQVGKQPIITIESMLWHLAVDSGCVRVTQVSGSCNVHTNRKGNKMRVYRKWNIVPILLIFALIAAWWTYTHTDEFKARRLIAELRYCKGSFQSPTGKDRWFFTAALATPRTRDFREVSDELVAMGESAMPFLLEEVQKFGKGNANSNYCAYLLAKIGTPAVRPLLEILEGLPQENTPNRMIIIRALAAVVPSATEAVPALLCDLKSDSGIVRNFAAIALAKIDPDVAARKALPIVLKDLEHPDRDLCFYATWALSEIGPRTEEAKSAIDKAKRGKFRGFFKQSRHPKS